MIYFLNRHSPGAAQRVFGFKRLKEQLKIPRQSQTGENPTVNGKNERNEDVVDE
ncbi:MAG: hypothetical protein NT150_05100 [Bacteroidetes bacterium]|nr:hypothetical protein [Bacteroidota bacterium]